MPPTPEERLSCLVLNLVLGKRLRLAKAAIESFGTHRTSRLGLARPSREQTRSLEISPCLIPTFLIVFKEREKTMINRRDFIALTGAGGAAWLAAGAFPSGARSAQKEERIMAYVAKDYTKLIGMPGFSETLLKNHFTLYQGYVTNTNKVLDTLAQMLKDGKTGTPEYAELKRRLGWEWNGMRLHELYFENLGGKAALDAAGKLPGNSLGNSGAMRRGRRISRPPGRCAASAGSPSTWTRLPGG